MPELNRERFLRCLIGWVAFLFCVCGASAQLVVTAVSPNQADPGTSSLTVTFTLPDTTPPTPPVAVSADSVMIGDLVGTSVTRVSLDTVTAVFDIPADEEEGAKDCVVTFTTPSGETPFILAGGFAVGEVIPELAYTNWAPAAGYNLLNSLSSKSTYLMDNDQNRVKSWTSSYTVGNAVYLSEDGSLMRTANSGSTDFDEGGAGGRVEQYDWDGNLIWAYDHSTSEHRLHHDVEVLPNGNVLMIAWEKKTEAEALAAGRRSGLLTDGELWPDYIIEVEPSGSYGGTIVWEWHVWDHLVTTDAELHPELIDINYALNGGADWQHMNSIDYNEDLDQVLLSVRNFSEIWVIDHDTSTQEAAGSAGDLLYRWGNPEAYGSGDASDQQLFVQHDATWIEAGLPGENNMLIFNNGQGRPDGDYSSVVELVPPVAGDGSYTVGLPLAPTWVYTNATNTDFYAMNISGAQRLANGNTLICEGTAGVAFEVTTNGALVWEYTAVGSLFRFERYAPDFAGFVDTELALPTLSYAIVDTAQTAFYNASMAMSAPGVGDAFYGQDGSYAGHQPCYERSPDGSTVYDYNTALTWTRSHDWNGDGVLNASDQMTQADAVAYVATLNAANYGGHDDWRLPSTKEIYSLMDFNGTDPDTSATTSDGLTPFIDTTVFGIGYGDLDAGDRIIDSQFATTTIYVDVVMTGQQAMFGLNLVDGRIKGYPTQTGKTYYALYCRGNTAYGVNIFQDNGDATVTDQATGLMWAQADSGSGSDWENSLAYAEASELAGHTDWRLPNAKELQSLLDYSRSPSTTASAAIDPVFSATEITNLAGVADYPWYWSGTTHLKYTGSAASGVYVCFGRGLGSMDEGVTIIDVHGAGCQRSDPKTGDEANYPAAGFGPQGDVQRVFNYVRLVRDASSSPEYDAMTVAGTFQGWNVDDANMQEVSAGVWQGTITMTNETSVLFKFAGNHTWDINWGDVDPAGTTLPLSGVGDWFGDDISMSGTLDGEYLFTFNVSTRAYSVEDKALDSDGDGLSDYDEVNVYSSNPNLADSDGDGLDDGDEVVAGSGLNDADSCFELMLNGNTLSWFHAADRDYTLEGCTNMTEEQWFTVAETTSSNSTLSGDYTVILYRVGVNMNE